MLSKLSNTQTKRHPSISFRLQWKIKMSCLFLTTSNFFCKSFVLNNHLHFFYFYFFNLFIYFSFTNWFCWPRITIQITAQKMRFSIQDFFSKCDQIRSFLRIWSYLLKKSLMENFIFCAANAEYVILVNRTSPWSTRSTKLH